MRDRYMKSDIFFGPLFVIVSIYMYFQADELPPSMYGTLGAGVFPKILFSLLAILGVILTINTVKILKKTKVKSDESTTSGNGVTSAQTGVLVFFSNYSYVFTGFLSVLAYMLLMKYLGYTFATLIFMPGLMWILGPKNLRSLWITALVTIGVTFSIYLLFQSVFRIFLPPGELF